MHFRVGDSSPLDPAGQVIMQTSANRLIVLRIFDGVALATTSNENIATPVFDQIFHILFEKQWNALLDALNEASDLFD